MNSKSRIKRWLANTCIALLPLLGCAPAMATIITGPFTFNGSGTGTGSVVTTTPGGAAGNVITLNKEYTSGGYIQTSFVLPNNDEGSTTYLVRETIVNNTGDNWFDFRIAMGCGAFGEEDCGGFFPLVLEYPPAADAPIGPPGAVLTSGMAPTLLHWVSATPLPTTFDLQYTISTCERCAGTWAIFQTPSLEEVPEPGSLTLVGVGILALRAGRRRRA